MPKEEMVGMREFLVNTHKHLRDGVIVTRYGVPVYRIVSIDRKETYETVSRDEDPRNETNVLIGNGDGQTPGA